MADDKTLADHIVHLPQPPVAGPHENRLLYQKCHGYDSAAMAATLAATSAFDKYQRAVFDSLILSLTAYEAGTMLQVRDAALKLCLLSDTKVRSHQLCMCPWLSGWSMCLMPI